MKDMAASNFSLNKLASYLLSLTTQRLFQAQRAGELIEVDCDAQDQVSDF